MLILIGHRLPSNHDPLDLIEADLIAPAIVELCRARRRVVCHRCRLLKCPPVLEVSGDPGRPEAVVAELGFDAARRGRRPVAAGWVGTPGRLTSQSNR